MDKYDMNGGLNNLEKDIDNPKANLARVAQNIKDRFGLNTDDGNEYFSNNVFNNFPNATENVDK